MEEALELTMEEMKETFLLLLDIAKCAVCLETVRKEMVQCVNGHLLCSDCKGDLEQCPTCRDTFSSSKPPHFVSQVIDILPTRCKYKDCSTTIKNFDDHEKYCGFKPTKCKLCSWEGPGKDIVDHCKEQHSDSVSNGNKIARINKSNLFSRTFSKFTLTLLPQNQLVWEETSNNHVAKMFTKVWHTVPNGKPTNDIFVTSSFKTKSIIHSTEIKIKLNLDPDEPSDINSIPLPHKLLTYFMNDSELCYEVSYTSQGTYKHIPYVHLPPKTVNYRK